MKPVSKIGIVLAAIALLIVIDYFFVRAKYRNLIQNQTSLIEKNKDAMAEEKLQIKELRGQLSECEEDNQMLVWSNREYKDLLKDKENALEDFSDAELGGDRANVFVFTLVVKRRRSCRHF